MNGKYKNLTYIYFGMNIIIFACMALVYYFYNIPNLVIYCGITFLLMCLNLIFHKKIPEIITLLFLLVNLDLYALFFSFTTGASAGIELYPLVLTGVCYLLTYDIEKPKYFCFGFASFSFVICLYISLFYNRIPFQNLEYSAEFYHKHDVWTTIIVIFCFMFLSICYEKVLKNKNESEKRRREELIHIANHDPLTHLINRRRLWEHLRSCEEQKNQIGTNYVISIFDIDSFKKVNDTYGHDCGDFILVEISKLIKENLPKNVKIGRWGGEEFLLLFRAYSDEKAIEEVEKLRKMIDETIFDFLGTKIHITLTFGVSSSSYCDSAEHIIIDADKQLMKGKIQGKNRVVARSLQKSLSENDTLFDSIIDTNHKE